MNEKKEQNQKDIRDALFINCPIRNVLARVGDKWSLLVLYNLQHKEPMRFKELQRQIPDISQKSLTQTLRTLKEDGFVSREVFPEIQPHPSRPLLPAARGKHNKLGQGEHGRDNGRQSEEQTIKDTINEKYTSFAYKDSVISRLRPELAF